MTFEFGPTAFLLDPLLLYQIDSAPKVTNPSLAVQTRAIQGYLC